MNNRWPHIILLTAALLALAGVIFSDRICSDSAKNMDTDSECTLPHAGKGAALSSGYLPEAIRGLEYTPCHLEAPEVVHETETQDKSEQKHCHDKQFVKSSSAFCPGAYEHVL